MTFQEAFAHYLAQFDDCDSPQAIKKLYKKLVFLCHPDINGPHMAEQMKALNSAYSQSLEGMHGTTNVGDDGKERTYRYNESHESDIMAQIDRLIRNLPADADVEIEVIGLWIWVTGDTKPYRAILKSRDEDGCAMTWHSKRVAWYWKPYKGGRSKFNPNATLDDLADTYGGHKVHRNRSRRSSSPQLG